MPPAPIDLQRPRDLGRILDDAAGLYRRYFKTLLLVALVVVVPVHLIVYGVGLGWLWSGYESPQTGGDVRLSDLVDQFTGLAAQLLVVTPLVTAMAVHVVRRAAAGAPAPAGETISAGLAVFARLFAAVLLVALGVGLGLLFLIIPGLFLAVRWAVVPQVVVVEGLSGSAALQRSFELTRGQGWFTFLVLLVTNLIVGVLSALAMVPLELAAEAADAQALSLLGQVIGAVFALPLLAVAQTLLYYALLARKGGAPAASPGERPSGPAIAGQAGRPGEEGQTLPGVPGTFGGGWAPPTAPDRDPGPRS
jgi:hypothetical protein